MKIQTGTIKQFALVTALTVMALLAINVLGANTVFAQAIDTQQDQPTIIATLSGGQTGLRGIVLTILNFFLTFLGLGAVVMVIYAGVLYVSSAGEEENVTKAKKILLYSVIGIVVIIISFALVNTILGVASNQRPQ